MSYVARTFSHTERGTVQMANVECVTSSEMNEPILRSEYNFIRHNNRNYSTTRLRRNHYIHYEKSVKFRAYQVLLRKLKVRTRELSRFRRAIGERT